MLITQSKFEGKAALYPRNLDVRGTSDTFFSHESVLKNSISHKRSSFDQNSVYSYQNASLKPSRLQGKYIGVAFGVGVPDNFKIRLKYMGGSRFIGQAQARNSSNSSLFVNTYLTSKIVDGALLLKQTRVIDDNLPPGSTPCLREGRLKIKISGGKVILLGPWKSDDPDCGFSKIRLKKQ